jgi:hypothetical protein
MGRVRLLLFLIIRRTCKAVYKKKKIIGGGMAAIVKQGAGDTRLPAQPPTSLFKNYS